MGIADYIKDILGISFKRTIQDIEHRLLSTVNEGIRNVERRIMKGMAAFLFILIGIAFLSIGAVFFLIEQLGLSHTSSFLIIAITSLLIGIIVKLMR